MSQTDIQQEHGVDANRILVIGAGVVDTTWLRHLHDRLSDHGFGVVVVDEVPPQLSETDLGRFALAQLARSLEMRCRTLSSQAPAYGWYRRFEGRRRDSHRF